MSKIYISGPISGQKIEESRAKFEWAVDFLAIYWYYADIVNPHDLMPFLGLKNWWCYMIADLWKLSECNAVYMLKGWEKSRGACVEHLVAVWKNKTIIYQD